MRTAIQVLLALPATLLTPFGWFFLIVGGIDDAAALPFFIKVALFVFGSFIGLLALWRSIILRQSGELTRPPRWLVPGLVIGLLLATFFIVGWIIDPPRYPDAPLILVSLWIIGGPFIVGIWNLIAILSPHQRP